MTNFVQGKTQHFKLQAIHLKGASQFIPLPPNHLRLHIANNTKLDKINLTLDRCTIRLK